MKKQAFNIETLSLSDKNHYAVNNVLQSIENARAFCSHIEPDSLRRELDEMIKRFKEEVEKKINDSF